MNTINCIPWLISFIYVLCKVVEIVFKLVSTSLGKRLFTKCSAAYCIEEVDPSVDKPPMKFNGGLNKLGLTSLGKNATGAN